MKTSYTLCILVISMFILACNSKENNQPDLKAENSNTHHSCSDANCQHNIAVSPGNSLEEMSLEELNELNRKLTKRYRSDFHSWTSHEPERWENLSYDFADDVLAANQNLNEKRDEIAALFVGNIEQRAAINNSNSPNRNQLMSQVNNDFRFNLQFLIGIEAYNNWQKANRKNMVKFKSTKDSISAIMAVQKSKINQLKNKES